ncbi:hypothetical protein [Methylocystis sp.]|uniref:hypothetical protein n=1 Tax=Methylocystis sp. TaxID=1911079 RepID=UPI003D0D8667
MTNLPLRRALAWRLLRVAEFERQRGKERVTFCLPRWLRAPVSEFRRPLSRLDPRFHFEFLATNCVTWRSHETFALERAPTPERRGVFKEQELLAAHALRRALSREHARKLLQLSSARAMIAESDNASHLIGKALACERRWRKITLSIAARAHVTPWERRPKELADATFGNSKNH